MRTSSDIDDTGRSGAGDWSQPSSVDLALDAGQMPAAPALPSIEEQRARFTGRSAHFTALVGS